MSSATPSGSRAALEDEVAEYERQIIHNKRTINSLIPINQLLPELLSEVILFWVAEHRMGWRRGLAGFNGVHSWIIIAQVCHLWREIALKTPRLWSKITITSRSFAEAMLYRSMQAPLHVDTFLGSSEDGIQRVLDHLARIETFSHHTTVFRSHPYVVGDVAPILRSLIYSVEPYSGVEDRPQATPFDNVEMPSLSRLFLINTRLHWTSPLLKPRSTLTQFVFKSWGYGHDYLTAVHMSEVLRVLRGMPMLERLALDRVLPDVNQESHLDAFPLVSLPILRNLSIVATAYSTAFLLQHLLGRSGPRLESLADYDFFVD